MAAHLVYSADDLEKLVYAIKLAKRNQSVVHQNLALSIAVILAPQPPDVADLALIRSAGIPVVSPEQFAAAVAGEADTRRLLLAVVEHDTRAWRDRDR